MMNELVMKQTFPSKWKPRSEEVIPRDEWSTEASIWRPLCSLDLLIMLYEQLNNPIIYVRADTYTEHTMGVSKRTGLDSIL